MREEILCGRRQRKRTRSQGLKKDEKRKEVMKDRDEGEGFLGVGKNIKRRNNEIMMKNMYYLDNFIAWYDNGKY